MKNKPYLIIGEKTYTMEQLYCLLFDPDCKPEKVDDEMLQTSGFDKGPILCQNMRSGVLQASPQYSSDEFPCLEFHLQTHADGVNPICLARVEQEQASDGAPNVYLYGRAESYIAVMPVDTRPEAELGDRIIQANLLVSGDSDCVVKVDCENQYVSFEGR